MIRQRWSYILGSEVSPAAVDDRTAQVLELLAPRYSTHDYTTVCDLIDDGQAFPSVIDETSRAAIKSRLKECDRIVTIRSFFDDMIYVKACFDSLRTVLPVPPKRGPSTRLRDELRQVYVEGPSRFLKSYIEIWLFCMRNSARLKPGKNVGVRVCNSVKGRQVTMSSKQSHLAHFARYLGFRTVEIDEMIANDDSVQYLEVMPDDVPELSCHGRNVCEHARSNRPCQATYQPIARTLYLGHVFNENSERCKTFVTPYALIRDIVLCLWGAEYRNSRADAVYEPLRTYARMKESNQPVSQNRARSCRTSLAPERSSVPGGQPTDLHSRENFVSRRESLPGVSTNQRLPLTRLSPCSSNEEALLHTGRTMASGASSIYSRGPDDNKFMATLDNSPYRNASSDLFVPQDRRNILDLTWDNEVEHERLYSGVRNHEYGGETMERGRPRFSTNHPAPTSSPSAPRVDDGSENDVGTIELASTDDTAESRLDRNVDRRHSPTNDAEDFFGPWDDSVDAVNPVECRGQQRSDIMYNNGRGTGGGKRRADSAEISPSPHGTRSAARLTTFPGQLGNTTAAEAPQTTQKQAWDAEHSMMQSILARDRKLSSNKVYVASSHDIAQPARRHPGRDGLWAWAEDEKRDFCVAFQRLSGEHTLKLVKQSPDYRSYTYEAADARTCWKKLWQSRQPDTLEFGVYPLAVLCNMERSPKIQRTNRKS